MMMRDKVRNTRHLNRFPRGARGSTTPRLYATRKTVGRKKKRAPRGALLVEVNLESKQDGEPRVERIHEALVLEGGAGGRMLEVGVRHAEAVVTELVNRGLPFRVKDVEHIECDLELQTLGYPEWIFEVRIHCAGNRCTTQVAAAEERHFTGVLIGLLG